MCNCCNEASSSIFDTDTNWQQAAWDVVGTITPETDVWDDIALFDSGIVDRDEVRAKWGYNPLPTTVFAVTSETGGLWHVYWTRNEAEIAAKSAEAEVGESWRVIEVEMDPA